MEDDRVADEDEAVFRSSPVGMAVMDETGRFVRANPALCRFLGREAAWLVGRRPADVTHVEDQPLTTQVARRLREHLPVGRVHKRYVRPDGTVVHGLVSATALEVQDGGRRTLAQIEDVTEQVRLEAELRRLASHDALTGLPGRLLLLERLQEALTAPHGAVGVVFIDLDAFKLINDALGHAAGDTVLEAVAARFRAVVRPQDTVGRLSGDEFLVVAPGLSEQEAGELAGRLSASLQQPVPFDGDEVFVSCSLGVSHRDAGLPVDLAVVERLVDDADAAMYEAKRRGKRRYEVFDSAMRSRAAERSQLAARVRAAVAEDRLVVLYQPVVSLPDETPMAVEALVRLRDVDGRLVSPSEFLEVAEQIGVLPEVDGHVLRTATRQVQQWRDSTGLDVHLAVNAGAGQLLRSLHEQVGEALTGSGLPADRLTVELTEQTLVDGLQAASETLRLLVERGVHLAIDDFGTGWASFTYLRRFPVSAIKIDRSFVSSLPAGQEDSVIVRTLADLAHQLGMACVVEGVETRAQLARLRELLPSQGCYVQGFLFGRPLPADEALEVLVAGATH